MLSIVNLYAKEYGWTRNEILDFPLDEHILNQEIIRDSQRNEYLMQAQISLLSHPNMDNKGREEFFKYFEKEQEHELIENTNTDFEGIRKAKEQLKNM
ncbi:hypothetical protein KHA95_05150 [Bacillus sp. FJAT-50079]|nr:hypothetical protein [Bacillus sp. FJAT-50079]